VVKGSDSIEFGHNVVAHAFFRNVIYDFVLVESSHSVDINRFLDVEHVGPLLHILRSIIIAVEWCGLSWDHQILNILVDWVVRKSTVCIVMTSVMSRSSSDGSSND